MSEQELKPCPFCGRAVTITKYCIPETVWGVGCDGEDCVLGFWDLRTFGDKAIAIAEWNRRDGEGK